MAIENKRMQQRSGSYADFTANKSRLLQNEFASVTSGDPNGGKSLHFSFGSGDVRRVMFEGQEFNAKVNELIDAKLPRSAEGVLY